MPWLEVSLMSNRVEFVRLASGEGGNVSELCRRFGISRKTGYKWLARDRAGAGLEDASRRPRSSPSRSPAAVEALVLALRAEHPSWGGRKLRRRLLDVGASEAPSASTITAILARHGCIDPAEGQQRAAFQRFEHPRPNALWQMDFKGDFATGQGRCHPLTLLDDHSRYGVCLSACADQTTATVHEQLTATFRRFGLPERMNMDNGSPWGDGPGRPYTPLGVWLMQLGVGISHSQPYHPQTNGKDERWHRTIKRDVLHGRHFEDLAACQQAFDRFRTTYNTVRPHEALGLAVPASRYQPSPRSYPETLPKVEYDASDQVRRVQQGGRVHFKGHEISVPKAFTGHHVALRPMQHDGQYEVIFIAQRVVQVDLTTKV